MIHPNKSADVFVILKPGYLYRNPMELAMVVLMTMMLMFLCYFQEKIGLKIKI